MLDDATMVELIFINIYQYSSLFSHYYFIKNDKGKYFLINFIQLRFKMLIAHKILNAFVPLSTYFNFEFS